MFFAEQELPQDIVYDKRSRGYRLIDNAQKKLSNSEVLAVCKILWRAARWSQTR